MLVMAARYPLDVLMHRHGSSRSAWRVTASSSTRSSASICNHTPLHRQSMILERDIGLEISRATLDGWVLKVGELLVPMVAAMRRELITGTYIQADETRSMYRCTRAEERIIKPICGSTADPEEAWCSTSV